ncbi:hypothetical protein D9M69_596580 [compost metagenome]
MRALSTPAATFVIVEVSDISIRRQKGKTRGGLCHKPLLRNVPGGADMSLLRCAGGSFAAGTRPGSGYHLVLSHISVWRPNRKRHRRDCSDAGPGYFRILRRGRAAGHGLARLQAATRASGAVPGHRPGHPGPRHAGGRGGHGHRQDVGLSCTRLHPGRQGADFHRHAHPAGPALRPRSSARARCAGRAGHRRAAQGPR